MITDFEGAGAAGGDRIVLATGTLVYTASVTFGDFGGTPATDTMITVTAGSTTFTLLVLGVSLTDPGDIIFA